MSIGENIKSLRESRGLTQAQLGDAVGVSDKAVSTWESGTRMPRTNAVDKLAAFFGIDKRDLLFCDDDHFYRLPGGWGTPGYLVETLMSDPPPPEIVKPILSYYEASCANAEQLTDGELSEVKRSLIQFALSLTDEQAALALRVLRSIAEDSE